MKKFISIILAAVMLVSVFMPCSFAADSVVADGIVEISKYGNVKINLPHSVISEYFELGDIVTVSFGNITVDVPLCISFSDVDSGSAGLFCQVSGGVEETELAVNMGNFAEKYGIAKKIVYPDKTYTWEYQNGFSELTRFTVTMKQKAGYLEEFTVRNLTYTNNREDYRELTDEQYANFRMVSAGYIADGVLFRSASPVDPAINRNKYADDICRKEGITHFVNLGDSDENLNGYEGYSDSYYKTVSHIAVAASMNPAADENKAKYAECFRYIIANPDGKFDVHCREGKERTGIFIAVIECLMGASYDEVRYDYMQSYSNFYGIKSTDEAYRIESEGNLKKTLTELFGINPESADLVKEAEEYLTEIGLSHKEIISLKKILSGRSIVFAVVMNIIIRISNFFDKVKNIFAGLTDNAKNGF